MRFPLPLLPAEFELPDEWWVEAGLMGFTSRGRAYGSTAIAVLVPLREIEPPPRNPERPLSWRGFDRARMISVLVDIATGAEIAPVSVVRLPEVEFPPSPYRYRVRDGFHRFYASVAAGFECLPVVIS
jgi:hypothetical protein